MRMKLAALAVATVAAFFLAIVAGRVWLWPGSGLNATDVWILWELRLPRAALAVLIGGGLGAAGAVNQGYLRNPLADPLLLGVGATAALGAVLALFFGAGTTSETVFAAALAGAAVGLAALMAISLYRASPLMLILAGTLIGALASALTSFVISIAPNPYAMGEIMTWMMGSLTDRGLDEVARAGPLILGGTALLLTTGRALDLLGLGQDVAVTLGVRPLRLQVTIVTGLTLVVGASVAVAGVIGFVGLVTPHLMRGLFGERPSSLLWPSALAGATLLLLADTIVRLASPLGELKLGVAMAMIGVPVFLWALLRQRGRWV